MTPRTPPDAGLDRLIMKLESNSGLTADEKRALAQLPVRTREVEKNADLVQQGDRPPESCLVLEGFVCRYKLLGEGQRQILSFQIPGDIPDLESLHLSVMDHAIAALTPARVAHIPHAALNDLILSHPGIAAALWRETLIDAAINREWLAGVGRRTAHQRIAHLICEVYARLRAVDLVDGDSFDLPVTQAELADALGLSSVHVNRVLQDLRKDGLITNNGRYVVIGDWDRLRTAGDFDPRYLHLRHDG